MNCENFLELSEWEQSLYLASLIHVCQSDNVLFKIGKDVIELGRKRGLFDGVKIFPEHLNNQNNDTDNLPKEH